jgi:hypothetical protein
MSFSLISPSHFYFHLYYLWNSGVMSLPQYKLFDLMYPKFTLLGFQRVTCNYNILGFELDKSMCTPSVSLGVS